MSWLLYIFFFFKEDNEFKRILILKAIDFKKNKGEVHWKDTRVSQRAEGLASEDGKDRCEDDVDLPPESSSLM